MGLNRNPVHELLWAQGRLKPRLRFRIWINVCEGGAELIGWRKIHINFPFSSITGNCWDQRRMCWWRLGTPPLLIMSKGGQIANPSANEHRLLHIRKAEGLDFVPTSIVDLLLFYIQRLTVNLENLKFLGAGLKEPGTQFSAGLGNLNSRWKQQQALGISGNRTAGVPEQLPRNQGTQLVTLAEGQPLNPAEVWDLLKKIITFTYYAGKRHRVKTWVKTRIRGDKYFIFKPYEFLSSSALSLFYRGRQGWENRNFKLC